MKGLLVGAMLLTVQAAAGQTVDFSGNVTVVGQAANDDRARAEIVSSLDLFLDVALGPALVAAYVESNTTPFLNGVSRLVGEANADAGTALGSRREGRVQLSELRLVLPLAEDLRAHAGLIDATGYIDVSRIANDENLFFLGVPFVNNPTIEFPDYSLGAAVEGALPVSAPLRIGAVVVASHGLADNPAVSYAQLLDLNDDGKGVFAGTALRWATEGGRVSVGAWVNSASHPLLDGSAESQTNRGAFAVVGRTLGSHSVSLRGGVANGRVSVADGFVGATYLLARRPNAIGLAVSRSFASEHQAAADDVTHGEAFVRRRIVGDLFLTASVQRLLNSGFDSSGSSVSNSLWIGGLRLSAQF